MIRFIGLLILTLLPEFAFGGQITVSPPVTDDSSIMISGTIDLGVKWIWLKVEKRGDDSQTQNLFPVLNGLNFSKKVYLKGGAGEYSVTAYQKSTDPQYGPGYYLIHAFPVTNQDQRNVQFLLPSENVQSDDVQILTKALQLTVTYSDDGQKSLAIHDWIATHIAYDVDSLFAGVLRNYTAKETLTGLKAYCSGYANLNAALHRAAGIPARVIIGKATFRDQVEDHAWNEIFANGKWMLEDTTWDAGGIQAGTNAFIFALSHLYFDPLPEAFDLTHGAGTVMPY